ncbi:hypothetical protein V6N13_124960 [Hibiscus sabdariffa]
MEASKKGFLPMTHGISLSKEMCPSTSQERERMSQVPYASATGSIMYAMICTHPDLSYALCMTSRYQANPGEGHWVAVKNILKYLRRTKDVFLVYGGEEQLSIKGYTDASFQTDKDDSRSQSGFVFRLNGGALAKRQKKPFVSKKFITELGVVPSISDALELYCDNSGAIAQAKEPRSHQRSKHILRRFHLIREIVDRGDVEICKVHTDDNIVDPLTKPLSQQKHDRHTESLVFKTLPPDFGFRTWIAGWDFNFIIPLRLVFAYHVPTILPTQVPATAYHLPKVPATTSPLETDLAWPIDREEKRRQTFMAYPRDFNNSSIQIITDKFPESNTRFPIFDVAINAPTAEGPTAASPQEPMPRQHCPLSASASHTDNVTTMATPTNKDNKNNGKT